MPGSDCGRCQTLGQIVVHFPSKISAFIFLGRQDLSSEVSGFSFGREPSRPVNEKSDDDAALQKDGDRCGQNIATELLPERRFAINNPRAIRKIGFGNLPSLQLSRVELQLHSFKSIDRNVFRPLTFQDSNRHAASELSLRLRGGQAASHNPVPQQRIVQPIDRCRASGGKLVDDFDSGIVIALNVLIVVQHQNDCL